MVEIATRMLRGVINHCLVLLTYHLCPGLTKPVNGRLVVPINLV